MTSLETIVYYIFFIYGCLFGGYALEHYLIQKYGLIEFGLYYEYV